MTSMGQQTIVEFPDKACECCGTTFELAGMVLILTIQGNRIHSVGERRYSIGEKALGLLKGSKVPFTIIGEDKQ